MQTNPALGLLLHALGGLAAGSFYIPYKQVKNWAWESYWITGGFFSWIIAPWVAAMVVCRDVPGLLHAAPAASLFWTYFFGVLWGVGGLTFGLSMRYLGVSLGYAMSLGFCAAFGTIIPPLFLGGLAPMMTVISGQLTILGVVVCLAGIAVCGAAGKRKEKEVPEEEKKSVVKEFSFVKGLWVAIFAGVMSACMAFAFQAGKPIAAMAVKRGVPDLFQNFPVLIVALAGGFTTNFIWCVALNIKNRTSRDYITGDFGTQIRNVFFAALAGVTWYLQFFFYGMGTTRMGKYDFASWTIHMAFIIVFSNMWGIYFKEWKGASKRTHTIVAAGIAILVLSTVVVGLGNYMAKFK